MSNMTVDAGAVIRRYQERLTEVGHANILLEARLEAVEAQLRDLQEKEAGTSSKMEASANGMGETQSSLSALPGSSG